MRIGFFRTFIICTAMVICFCNISTASDPSNVSLYIEKADIFEKDNDYKLRFENLAKIKFKIYRNKHKKQNFFQFLIKINP